VRRTRSALKLAGDALPGGIAARFGPEFKWLGDLTTPTRDLDVYLDGFGQMAGRLSAAAPADLGPFRAHLAARRAAEQRKLARGLRSARFTALMADWRDALGNVLAGTGLAGTGLAGTGRAKRGRAAPGDIASLASSRIARAYRRVARRGAALTAAGPASAPPPAKMHALRKRGKELRYLLEFFGSLYEPAALRQAVKDLKGLQDCLGNFQDAEVQRDGIREFAAAMLAECQGADRRPARRPRRDAGPPAAPPLSTAELAATLLAMGELTAVLHAQQERARAEVAGRFAAFARAGGVRTLSTHPRTAQA
jgi:CHAD domain-containing protein